MANAFPKRRDSKHRILRRGESVREDGLYQFKYHVNGKPKFVYSWRLEPTDKVPQGKKPGPSLRELEKQIGYDLDAQMDPTKKSMTVLELVGRYLATKTGVKPSTRANYQFVLNFLKQEDFGGKKIGDVKTSDAKLFLIKMQAEGRGYSSVKTVRGVLRPAFQMAVDDDYLQKNPFGFQLAGVVINDSVTREAITKDQMRKFLKFVRDDNNYCKYYEAFYILFHTGMRISEFCGLTIRDLDMEKRIIDINKQLQRGSKMEYFIESTKTNAGTRKIPMTEEVFRCFQAIRRIGKRRRSRRWWTATPAFCTWTRTACRKWPCTGSIGSSMRWTATTISTGSSYRRSPRTSAGTPTAATRRRPA